MRLKNIIIVYDYAFINGGAAKIAIQSAISLSKQNYNVYYYSAVGPVCKDLMSSNVKTHCLNQKDINTANRITAIRTGIWNSSVKKDFHHFLSSFSQEDTIVHIHGWVKALSSAVVKTSTKMKFKTFITLHDYFTLCPNGGFYNFKRNSICHFKGFGLKCLLCNCDKRNYIQKLWRSARQVIQDFNVKRNADIIFISISNLNEKLIKPFVKSKRFERVDNFITIPPFLNTSASTNKTFIFIGRLSEEKGVEIFCRVMEKIISTHKDIKAIIVGSGKLYELKNSYPNVDFIGWKTQTEIYELLKRARAFILPSIWYEGAPLTVMEALSMNLPCIISNCTASTEIVNNGENGIIFEANNETSLLMAINKALNDNTIKLLQTNISNKNYRNIFSIDKHIKKLISIYKNNDS